jgi:hypothetical protein
MLPCERPLGRVAGGVRAPAMLGNGSKGKKGKGVLEWGFRREYSLCKYYCLLWSFMVRGKSEFFYLSVRHCISLFLSLLFPW